MHKVLIGVFPLVFLVGCSCEAPVQRATQPCLYKDQKLCKDRDIFQMKSELYLTALQKYTDCVYTRSRYAYNLKENCGKQPEWKDFK